MNKKAVEKLEEEYIGYIKTFRYCKNVDANFIFSSLNDSDYSYAGYDDYSDYSDD